MKTSTLVAWCAVIALLLYNIAKADISADNNISSVLYDANNTGDPYEKPRLLHPITAK